MLDGVKSRRDAGVGDRETIADRMVTQSWPWHPVPILYAETDFRRARLSRSPSNGARE